MPIDRPDMENPSGIPAADNPSQGGLPMPDHAPGIGNTPAGGNPAPLPDTPDVEGELEGDARTGRQIEER